MNIQTNLNHPFLTTNVLNYVGGKNNNLEFINKKIDKILPLVNKEVPVFVDLFSGTGIVSRLAKLKGMKVIANDFELYSQILTRTPIRFYKEQVENHFEVVYKKLFLKEKIENSFYVSVLHYLNGLEKVKYNKNNYFSINFAPNSTKQPDKKNERLYFSHENANKIDAIIEAIFNNKTFSKEARDIVLSSLIIEVINVINNDDKLTRSFYPEIGRGKKELKERVLSELTLTPFVFLTKAELNALNKDLITHKNINETYRQHAEVFFDKVKSLENDDFLDVDITYLDPPFQQQQYSSNYSLLNSICLNDKKEVESVDVKKFVQREDALQSNFCKKAKNKKRDLKLAQISLAKTFESIESKYILYSYVPNTVLTITEIMEIFSQNGSNFIEIDYELSKNEVVKKDEKGFNNVEHCLLTIQKGKRQRQDEINFLVKELKGKAVIPDNETFKVNQKHINIEKLLKENSDWKSMYSVFNKKTKLFNKDKFIFEVNENLMILSNIDTDFNEEDKKIVGQYIISEEKAKEIKNKKAVVELPKLPENIGQAKVKIVNEALPTRKEVVKQQDSKNESKANSDNEVKVEEKVPSGADLLDRLESLIKSKPNSVKQALGIPSTPVTIVKKEEDTSSYF